MARFLFSCDTDAPLVNDRQQLWQEAARMYQMGAFGDPRDPDTRILLWTKLELLHYPGAGDTREYLEKKKEAQTPDSGE